MFDIRNAKISDFEVVENDNRPQRKHKDKVFVPFCRVKKGFESREHEVSDMPEEIYALFKNRI